MSHLRMGSSGVGDTPENQQAMCRLLTAENTTAAHGRGRCCGAGPVALARRLDVYLTAASLRTGVPTGAEHGSSCRAAAADFGFRLHSRFTRASGPGCWIHIRLSW